MKFLHTLLLASSLVFCSTAYADDHKVSCDDLTILANELDVIAELFDASGTIVEDGELDQALGELVDAIGMIADIENSPELTYAVNKLTRSYDQMDADRFADALELIIVNLDKLYERDC